MHYNDVQYLFSSSGPTYTAVGQLKKIQELCRGNQHAYSKVLKKQRQ